MNPNELSVNLDNGFLRNNLYKPDINKFVWSYMDGFNVLNYIASRGQEPRKADARLGEVQDYLMELPVVQALISSVNVISSQQLQINFSAPTTGFRVMGNVTNNNALNTRAREIYVDPAGNYIIIESLDDNQVLNSANWPANTWITEEWNTHPYQSTGMTSIYYNPSMTYNYCEKMRETVLINLDDTSMTWVEGDNGNMYWACQQESLAFEAMMRGMELRAFKGVRALWSTDNTTSNGGLEWAIKDPLRGGIYQPYFSTPSLPMFTQWINDVANRYNESIAYLTVLCGRGALETFQSFTENYIQYAGIRNTFGGEAVKGIDTYQYAVGGINVQLVHLPSLNSPDYFRNPTAVSGLTGSVEYNTMAAIDLRSMASVASTARQMPLQRIYRGKQEMIYKIMPGVVDAELLESMNMTQVAVTDADCYTTQFLSRSGLNAMARNFGLWQPGM